MSFKNLEQRFTENVNKLYDGATLKFEGGKASIGKADAPLITRVPGKGYWSKYEDRGKPVQSTIQDVKRLTLFQISKPGLLFLAKQQLLQSGNTFEQTRLINPAFVIANATPFLHVRRNLRPFNNLSGKTDTSDDNVKKLGQLQVTTYNTLSKSYKSQKFIRDLYSQSDFSTSKKLSLLGAVKTTVTSAIKSQVTQLLSPIVNTISSFTAKNNIGDKLGGIDRGWNKSRPELNSGKVFDIDLESINYQTRTSNYFRDKQIGDGNKIFIQPDVQNRPFLRYFSSDAESIRSSAQGNNNLNAQDLAKDAREARTKISYIKDPSNLPSITKNSKVQTAYSTITTQFDDPIVVSFAMGNQDPIRFRAFIKDLHENVIPTYSPRQYIGRIEKFINYTGVQRDISFKLGIVAFSKSELDGVWARINYLTGLAFPYKFTKGLLQPNIVTLTIGNVYVDQPGYITGLGTSFNELSESWEIDDGKQVPISATMDMKFTLIEKTTKIADSPFYGITEKMEGFRKPDTESPPLPNPSKEQVSVENRTTQTSTYDKYDISIAAAALRSTLIKR